MMDERCGCGNCGGGCGCGNGCGCGCGFGGNGFIAEYDKMIFKKKSTIENVIFNDPATIVFWADGTKTVVKCGEDDIWDPEKGLAMAVTKKFFGNEGFYYDIFKKWIPEEKQMDTIVVDGRPLMNALASQGLGEITDVLNQFGSIIKKVEESK